MTPPKDKTIDAKGRRSRKHGRTAPHKVPDRPGVRKGKIASPEPVVVIDEEMLFEAARTHASYDSLGMMFGVSGDYLYKHYLKVILTARENRLMELRASQFYTAIEQRNPIMQIWLGKQYLGQMDKARVEQTGADGKPIETTQVRKVVAYIPDNGRD